MIPSRSLLDPVTGRSLIPPLEQGDHLALAEFERRFDAMPTLKKAELIEGVVRMGSPVRWEQHGQPHVIVSFWIGVYLTATPFVRVADNASIRLDGGNMPQPDVAMMLAAEKGGQSRLGADDYLEGAPELIVEIAASTASIDLNIKLGVYQRNNVREYIVWRVLDAAIDWFHLDNGEYRLLLPGADGVTRSEVFPGLWLDVAALIAMDFARVLGVTQQGLADGSHAAFVARLGG